MSTKICGGKLGCGLEKSLYKFNIQLSKRDGYSFYCSECCFNIGLKNRIEKKEELKTYRKQFKINNPEIVKERKRRDRENNRETCILNACKNTSREKNITFLLVKEDIIVPKFCPVYGIELKNATGYQNDSSISIDRINNKIGYIKENIIIVSWKANRFKRDSSFKEMTLMYKNFNKNNVGQETNHNLDYYKKELLQDVRKRIKRAAKKGVIIPYDLTPADINFQTHCPILGIELKRGKGQPIPNSPSIDRIDNTKGYVKDNVRIISYRANELKNNASYEDYKTLYLFYKKLINKQKKLADQKDQPA